MRSIITKTLILPLLLLSAVAPEMALGASAGGVLINHILPPNQDPGVRGYYDVKVEPGQKQELVLEVWNTGEVDMTFSVSPVTATTNRDGVVAYTESGQSDESLKYPFSEMAELSEERFTLRPGEFRDVIATVTMPEESFDGIMLGAIAVLWEPTGEGASEGSEATGAESEAANPYMYVVGARIRMTDEPVEAEFLLGEVGAEYDGGAAVTAQIRNPQPLHISGAAVSAKVYLAGSGTEVYEASNDNVSFAPNSIFPFTLVEAAGQGGAQAGDYLAKIEIEHEGRLWNFESEFEIPEGPSENQDEANQRVSGVKSIWIAAAIVSGTALTAFITVLILKINSDRKWRGPRP